MFLSVDPQTLPNFFVGSGGGSVARMIRGSLSRGQQERHHRERWQPQLHCSLGKSFLLESWGFKPRQGRVSGRDPAGAGPAELGSPPQCLSGQDSIPGPRPAVTQIRLSRADTLTNES